MNNFFVLNEIGFIGVDNFRSRAYLQMLYKNSILVSKIIIIGKKNKKKYEFKDTSNFFDYNKSIEALYSKININIINTGCKSINSNIIKKLLGKSCQKYYIYSGIPGEVISEKIININKKFIHIHPGRVPQYKGSTTHYYYLFKKRKIVLTALFLNKIIDSGEIIDIKEYLLPRNLDNLDYVFDPYFRSLMLLKILKRFIKTNKFSRKSYKKNGDYYYIIHPVLKKIAIS